MEIQILAFFVVVIVVLVVVLDRVWEKVKQTQRKSQTKTKSKQKGYVRNAKIRLQSNIFLYGKRKNWENDASLLLMFGFWY